MKIAESNFRVPAPLDPSEPVVGDKGFFGRGIYFTQYPSYGDYYRSNQIRTAPVAIPNSDGDSESEMEASQGLKASVSATASAPLSSGSGSPPSRAQQTEVLEVMPPLLLSWVLLGRVYPVIESPIAPADQPLRERKDLHGKPCIEGYDSHYAIVDRYYFPCHDDEEPMADEAVVFRPSQILPRYLMYYRKSATSTVTTSSSRRNAK